MRKWWRWRRVLALGCVAIVVGAGAAVWRWVVPALIVAQIRKHHEGHVTIRGWWIGRSSAGVTGLTLHESSARFSPVWATAQRVTTDLSIGSLLRGRVSPRRITLVAPRIVYRISEDGRLTSGMPFRQSNNGTTPELLAERGRLTLAHAGRPAMVVDNVDGRLEPDQNGSRFRFWSGDARWGHPVVAGRFGPGFQSVQLRLTAGPFAAGREKAARVPFVKETVWGHFVPAGPVRVAVDYERSQDSPDPAVIKTVVDFERTRIILPHLRLTASDAVGRIIFQDNVVRVDEMRGELAGGRVAMSGTMNFQRRESRYALTVGVNGIDLMSLPTSWRLDSVGLTGRLTGTARLLMGLTGRGLNLTGSTGRGTIEGASIRGIPLGPVELTLRGEGLRADIAKADQGVFLPQWIGSDFEVRNVDLKRVLAHVGANDRAGEIPVTGRLGLRLKLRMPLGTLHEAPGISLSDPHAWSGSGSVEGPEIGFRSARFRDVSARLALESGRLNVSDLAASLDGHVLKGEGAVDLKAPHAFVARLDASGLPLAELSALAPSTALRGKVSGTVAGRAEASGALTPWRVETRGRATIDHALLGRVVIGDFPFEWETRGETVVVTARDVKRYGGRLSTVATLPLRGDRLVEATVSLSHVDTAQLSAEVPVPLKLTGRADGEARFRMAINDDPRSVRGEATLTSPSMTIAGIPATSLRATIAVLDGVPKFEAHAEGLEGTFVVKGSGRAGQDPQGVAIDADVRAAGFQLASLFEALGKSSGLLARVQGGGTVAARVQTRGSRASTHAEGSVELRDLKWGDTYELGQVGAGFVIAPDRWRLENLEGTLWDGPIRGEFWRRGNGHEPPRYGLDLRLESASLARIFAFEPGLGQRFDGRALFTAQGHTDGSFRGRGELRVEEGHIHRLPIIGLSIPIEWDVTPEQDLQGTVRVRNARARVAGGRLHGDAIVALGPERRVHAELTLEQIDMRAISGVDSRAGRPMPGVIDGVVTLDSPNIARVQDYTGAIDIDLTGASLVDIPVLECLDSALGSAQGAVFDDGDLRGHIAHRAIHVERLTLVGPLAQLHATGTIGFDGRLDLRAFVNTGDTISVNGQSAIGQLSNAARNVLSNEQAIERMADFFSSRLMKFRIQGTLAHPSYAIDGSIHVDRMVIAFFINAMSVATSGASR